MTENEILDFYNENWTDYNSILDMLHKIIDERELEIFKLQKQLREASGKEEPLEEIKELKRLLHECQDNLDEERHKL